MPWVKVYSDILTDRKLLRLSRTTRYTFIECIVLAGDCDSDGLLIDSDGALPLDYIAMRFNMTVDELRADMEILMQAGLIALEDDAYSVPKFHDRQGRPQSERQRTWRESKARLRAKAKQESTESPIGHQQESTESPPYRVEKSREEKTGAIAPTASQNLEPQKPLQSSDSNGNQPQASAGVMSDSGMTPEGGQVDIKKMDEIVLAHASRDASEKAIMRQHCSDRAKDLMYALHRESGLPFTKSWTSAAIDMENAGVAVEDMIAAYKKLRKDGMTVGDLHSVKKTAIVCMTERRHKPASKMKQVTVGGHTFMAEEC